MAEKNSKLQIVDLHGIGNSGKSAVGALLSEFSNVYVFPYNYEFELFRASGGLNDLYYHLAVDWTDVGADIAIKRFKKLIKRIGTKATLSNPYSMFVASGHNYDQLFNKKFFKHTDEFLSKIIQHRYKCAWPFDQFIDNSFKIFYKRIRNRLFPSNLVLSTVYVAPNNNIAHYIYEYIVNLFSEIIPITCDTVVLNNAFISPFLASAISEFKTIIVLRDPRDMYVCTKRYIHGTDKTRNPTDVFSTDNISSFIQLKKQALDALLNRKELLQLQFEALIFQYDATVQKISDYLHLTNNKHSHKRKNFLPEKSRKNVGLWQQQATRPEILKIAKELAEYCLPESYY